MAAQSPRGPFGQPLNIPTHMHAPQMMLNSTFGSQSSLFSSLDSSFVDVTEESAKKIAALQAKLDKKLGPEYISQRPGPGGGPKLTYAEGWKIINLANDVFGFNGWSSSVVSITTDFVDFSEESRRYNVGVTAIVRVTLRDGAFHEDVGYGLLENSKSKGAALDKCKKEAVTDAVKRTLRNFGNLLGNCLYDKAYTQEVIKIKVPPPKFDRSDLHRRPEFEEPKPDMTTDASISTTGSASTSRTSSYKPPVGPSAPIIKSEPVSAMPPPMNIPQRYPAPHSNAMSTPTTKGKAPLAPTGLHTPVQTPGGPSAPSAHVQRQQNVGGMAQKTADRHAARLKAIQEAQDAQRREVEEAARAAAPAASSVVARTTSSPAAATTSAAASDSILPSSVAQPAQDEPSKVAARWDDDEYHFSSEDDAFIASIDLGALDEGIGRPIDFEEGQSAVTETDGEDACERTSSVTSTGASNAHGGSSVAGSNVNGQRAPTAQQPPQNKAGAAPPAPSRLQTSYVNKAQNQNVPPAPQAANGHTSSSSERPRTPSMGGGFSYPGGQPQGADRVTSSQAQSSVRQPSGGMNLKRTADIMQGINQGLASRRTQQHGMGLQNPPAPHRPNSNTSGNGSGALGTRREPLAALELGEGGDVKRARRQ